LTSQNWKKEKPGDSHMMHPIHKFRWNLHQDTYIEVKVTIDQPYQPQLLKMHSMSIRSHCRACHQSSIGKNQCGIDQYQWLKCAHLQICPQYQADMLKIWWKNFNFNLLETHSVNIEIMR
jgi:hypothetical protein